MSEFQVRQHESNANLWWVSLQGKDVAYITRPGNSWLAWTTYRWKSGPGDFVGKCFDSVDEALEAVMKSLAQA